MQRREFLTLAGTAAAASFLCDTAIAQPAVPAPVAEPGWRTFEVVTEVEMRPDAGASKLWLPMPLTQDTEYHRALSTTWSGNPDRVGIEREPRYGAAAFYAEWTDGKSLSELKVTTRIMTRNRSVDLSASSRPHYASREELLLYTAPTRHIPTDGIVAATSRKIVASDKGTAVERSRAIYEWIVENTYRDPKTLGCGSGDIVGMLESGKLGGKCADLNALFVGLARASGVPARDIYGVRVADSATWKSLGKSGDITRAQHCRAEFYDAALGWVPVDPADVRKVMLEEEKDRQIGFDDARVKLARERLFGSWEMNWMAFNMAGDTRLSPQTALALGHFMYPYAETAGAGTLSSYSPDTFRYTIKSRELSASELAS